MRQNLEKNGKKCFEILNDGVKVGNKFSSEINFSSSDAAIQPIQPLRSSPVAATTTQHLFNH